MERRQQAADTRRLGTVHLSALGLAPGYEAMDRRSAAPADADMLARHQHITRRRGPSASDGQALALRRRQLELLRLQAG